MSRSLEKWDSIWIIWITGYGMWNSTKNIFQNVQNPSSFSLFVSSCLVFVELEYNSSCCFNCLHIYEGKERNQPSFKLKRKLLLYVFQTLKYSSHYQKSSKRIFTISHKVRLSVSCKPKAYEISKKAEGTMELFVVLHVW